MEINIEKITGLSETEALKRQKEKGFNEIPSEQNKPIFFIVLEILKEPMFLLLIFCVTVYFLMGDTQEAFLLGFFVLLIVFITIYQEAKAEKAVQKLRSLTSPRALVIRDGKKIRIPGREVVVGDYVLINEGDRVPSDALLIWGVNVKVDESILTGESVSVRKVTHEDDDLFTVNIGGEDQPFVFSGTVVVQGQGIARIIAIGRDTQIGKIGKIFSEIKNEPTKLKKEIGRLVKIFSFIAILTAFLIVVIKFVLTSNLSSGILEAVSFAMSLIPEEFPVVLTIFFAMGALKMSRRNVLVRKVDALEELSTINVLCVDKTGTLTENKMGLARISVDDIWKDPSELDLNNDASANIRYLEVLKYSLLASKRAPFDPMEKAIVETGEKLIKDNTFIWDDLKLVREIPMSKDVLAVTQIWGKVGSDGFIIATKGAPESIVSMCKLHSKLEEIIAKEVMEMAEKGMRVIAVAQAFYEGENIEVQTDFDYKFLGLLAFKDPVRENVPAVVQEAQTAGIRIVMITGDYPVTASAVAKEIGIENPDDIMTGSQLEEISLEELKEKITSVNVFARIVPEQKYKIVEAFKSIHCQVAMTGDGVNDAPALKAADVGIAMGERGTDVAREASDIVLVKDDFNSIINAIGTGRKIYENIKRAVGYIISVHIPIIGAALLPLVFKLPPFLLPVHIVLLELIIDPVSSIVFEAEKASSDIMKRPPRNPRIGLFNKGLILRSIISGILSLFLVCLAYIFFSNRYEEQDYSRTMAYLTMIGMNLSLVTVLRWSKFGSKINIPFVLIILSVVALVALIILIPPLRMVFHFVIVDNWLLYWIGLYLVGVVLFSLLNYLIKKHD